MDIHCWRTNGKKKQAQNPVISFPLFYSLTLVLRSIYTLANASAQTPSTLCAHACWSSPTLLALWHYITLHDHPSLMGQTAKGRSLFHPNTGWRRRHRVSASSSVLLCPVPTLTKRMQNPKMWVRNLTHPTLRNLLSACRNISLTYCKHLSGSCPPFLISPS